VGISGLLSIDNGKTFIKFKFSSFFSSKTKTARESPVLAQMICSPTCITSTHVVPLALESIF
jgi:hypothetical protein